jgi:hypothetical protein
VELPAMKTVYWPEEGDWAEEWPLCEKCYAEVADEVLIVPGPYSVWGWCNFCKGWHSLNDMARWSGGGPHSAPQGSCLSCAGGTQQNSQVSTL